MIGDQVTIPTDKEFSENSNWIDYKSDYVYIIEKMICGQAVQFQFDGVSCNQACVNGILASAFRSRTKYFTTDFWYSKTCWGDEYPNKIYFSNKDKGFNFLLLITEEDWEKQRKKQNAIANEKAKPVDKILRNILDEVRRKTNVQYELDFEELSYGIHWFEAYIPLKYKERQFILTWQNCD